MAKCNLCAMYEFCTDAPTSERCPGFISLEKIREKKKDCCKECEHFFAEVYTCALDPEGEILSIYYCCDKFKERKNTKPKKI